MNMNQCCGCASNFSVVGSCHCRNLWTQACEISKAALDVKKALQDAGSLIPAVTGQEKVLVEGSTDSLLESAASASWSDASSCSDVLALLSNEEQTKDLQMSSAVWCPTYRMPRNPLVAQSHSCHPH